MPGVETVYIVYAGIVYLHNQTSTRFQSMRLWFASWAATVALHGSVSVPNQSIA